MGAARNAFLGNRLMLASQALALLQAEAGKSVD